MWAALFFGLSAVVAVAGFVCVRVYFSQKRRIRALEKARDRLELEESQVFDFFHGLGAAVSDETKPRDLHRLIVEGTLRILDGSTGAVYLADRKGEHLRPEFVSKGCPMFVDLIASAWRACEALHLSDDPRLGREGPQRPASAMICPLVYGSQKLGLLVVSRRAGGEPFPASAFKIFKGISEQSAFALYNAFIFSEAAEKKRIDQDLQVAHEIQRILLPSTAPDVLGYQISGVNIPARHVSGDYYDYIGIDEEHCGIAIADVSGKGVPASLIMAMCRSVLRSQAAGQHSAAHVLQQVNAQLFPDIREDMFISMAYAILDRNSSTVTLCRAGHDAPLLYRAKDRTIAKVNPPGMAVGIDSGGVFNRVTNDFSLSLEPDDCLILYTDGVTEALDRQGAEFGMENVIRSILASASEGAAGIITKLTDDLRAFVGAHPQHDDITLIVIRKK
jgi:sigma-B regulation protein RsbU (phosphoserine phosphatase)